MPTKCKKMANSNDTSKQDIYENYVIRSNVQLQEENAKLKEKVNELQTQCDELEEDISRKEQRTVNEKGLMHNLYDIKQNSVKISNYYKSSLSDYYSYADFMYNNVYCRVTPRMITAFDFFKKYTQCMLILPILSYYIGYISMFESLLVICYQFIPFPFMYLYVKFYTKDIKANNYTNIQSSYIRNMNKIKELQDEVNETERGCCSLDNIIDDM